MTASDREFDALIAWRVFGVLTQTVSSPGVCERYSITDHDNVRPIPAYSTDIAAAWLVVEHLRSAGFAPLLMFAPADVETDAPCHASLIRSYEESMGCEIEIAAETMPLAICRVALMAHEVPKEGEA